MQEIYLSQLRRVYNLMLPATTFNFDVKIIELKSLNNLVVDCRRTPVPTVILIDLCARCWNI